MSHKILDPSSPCRQPERGGVIVELSLVTPVLLLIFGGLLSVGRVVNQLSWMSQTAYQSVLLGAEFNNRTDREGRMTRRSEDLRTAAVSTNQSTAHVMWVPMTPGQDYGGVPRTVVAEVHGGLESVFGPVESFQIRTRVAGPILAFDATSLGDLSRFESPTQVGCNGLPGSCPRIVDCGGNPVATSCPCLTGDIVCNQ